jgi:hypothetical protein
MVLPCGEFAAPALRYLSKWTIIRASRNLAKGRIYFLPVDAAVWASALWTATFRTLRFSRARSEAN